MRDRWVGQRVPEAVVAAMGATGIEIGTEIGIATGMVVIGMAAVEGSVDFEGAGGARYAASVPTRRFPSTTSGATCSTTSSVSVAESFRAERPVRVRAISAA